MSAYSFDDLQTILTDFPQIDPPEDGLPHHRFNIKDDDTRSRIVSGYLALFEKDPEILSEQGLQALLNLGNLDDDARQQVKDLILEKDSHLQEKTRSALRTLSTDKAPTNTQTATVTPTEVLFRAGVPNEDGDPVVHFGWELTNVRATRHTDIPVVSEAAAFLTTLMQAVQIWQDRVSLGAKCQLNWRYKSDKHRVRIALLATVSAPDENQASEIAHGLQATLVQHLPLPDLYRFEALISEELWSQWRGTTDLKSVAEIQRVEHSIQYGERTLYVVEPIQADSDRLNELLLYLREVGSGQIVDIQVMPTILTPPEQADLKKMFNTGDPTLDGDVPLDIASILVSTLRDQASEPIRRHYAQLIRQLQQRAFLVRVRVGSTTTPDILPLATLTGRALLGLGAFEVQPGVFDPHAETPISFDDLPQRSDAPEGLRRLRWIWTLPETALVIRLPRANADGLPGIPRLRLKTTRIPTEMPDEGVVLGHALGENHTRIPAYIADADRSRHIYIVGRTGTGKTTLLHNMALQDIEAGHGVGVIDPHGDLIESLLARIPPERAKDVILFDPSDVERPLGLNLIDVEGTIARNMAVSDFIGLMYAMYDPGKIGIVGPRFEQSVRNAMFTAMDLPGATLIDVLRIIADNKFSREAREYLKDPVISDYWKSIYEGQSDFHRSEVKDYITSKFSRFTSDRLVRQIIGQARTTLDFGEIMSDKKILLVNLSKGRIGEFNSHFLGFILVSRLMLAALQRVQLPSEERIPFHVYLDEFQNFATPGMATLLAEGRKYGICLTLANQFTVQIPGELRDAVFGNVGTLCSFQVGLRDAEMLAQEFYPVFGVDDLVNLPAHYAAVKMLSYGQTLSPYALGTLPERNTPSGEVAEAIRQFSRYHYGRSSLLVDDEIRVQFSQPLAKRIENAEKYGK